MKPGLTAQLLRGARWPAIAAVGIADPLAAHTAADPYPDLLDAAMAIAPPLAVALVLAWRSQQQPWMLLLCDAASVCSRIHGATVPACTSRPGRLAATLPRLPPAHQYRPIVVARLTKAGCPIVC